VVSEGPGGNGGGNALKGVQVLIVDDEEPVRRAFKRLLGAGGAQVVDVADATTALDALARVDFDVVLVDLQMPGASGLTVLRSVRERNLDAACIIVTGQPEVETAVEALRLGAFDYLNKVDAVNTLRSVVARAAALTRLARAKREAQSASGRPSAEPGDLLGLDVALTRTLESLWMAYQPIVSRDGALFGYEALMRSSDRALPHPGAILEAAERLGRLTDVGRRTRGLVGADLTRLDDGLSCFVNLHPSDLADPALIQDLSLVAEHGERIVLEVTERESLDGLPDPRASVGALRERGCRIAVDDLGAGYAGLTSFAHLEPEIVKIDMSLVRGVDQDRRKAHILGRIVDLCHDLGVLVVAEGVETAAERDVLLALDCDLFQGFLIAKPAPGFPSASWPGSAPGGAEAS
jgi:EAL domain-containing protein (putative c-di-GMP-specific phosphodiesterase class I)/CheY-like chemotaxis protein